MRIYVFPNDHAPPHVHVYVTDGGVKVLLGNGWVALGKASGQISEREVRRAGKLVLDRLDECWRIWERIHGQTYRF